MEDLCTYFLSAFNSLESKRTESATDEASAPVAITSAVHPESRTRLQIDVMRALSAALFENSSSIKEVSFSKPRSRQLTYIKSLLTNTFV